MSNIGCREEAGVSVGREKAGVSVEREEAGLVVDREEACGEDMVERPGRHHFTLAEDGVATTGASETSVAGHQNKVAKVVTLLGKEA